MKEEKVKMKRKNPKQQSTAENRKPFYCANISRIVQDPKSTIFVVRIISKEKCKSKFNR